MAKRRKTGLKKHKTKFKFLGLILFIQILFLAFNDFGIIRWINLNSQKNTIQNEVEFLLNQQIKLQNEIVKLKTEEMKGMYQSRGKRGGRKF